MGERMSDWFTARLESLRLWHGRWPRVNYDPWTNTVYLLARA